MRRRQIGILTDSGMEREGDSEGRRYEMRKEKKKVFCNVRLSGLSRCSVLISVDGIECGVVCPFGTRYRHGLAILVQNKNHRLHRCLTDV